MELFKRIGAKRVAAVLTGMILGIGSISALSYLANAPLLIASFGASAVFLFAVPASPMAHKRNVLFGHLISACFGVATFAVLGDTWYSVTIAITLACLGMLFAGMMHPPGGATAIIAVVSHAGPLFILIPVLAGSLVLIGVSFLADKVGPSIPFKLSQQEHGSVSISAEDRPTR